MILLYDITGSLNGVFFIRCDIRASKEVRYEFPLVGLVVPKYGIARCNPIRYAKILQNLLISHPLYFSYRYPLYFSYRYPLYFSLYRYPLYFSLYRYPLYFSLYFSLSLNMLYRESLYSFLNCFLLLYIQHDSSLCVSFRDLLSLL